MFTYNSYQEGINYNNHLKRPQFRVKRAVIGYEKAPLTGTRHLQGYVELHRSVRLAVVKKIFPTAHWEPAIESALNNYLYCTKSGKYDIIGDFTKEIDAKVRASKMNIPVACIVAGLMDQKCSEQIKVTKEYAKSHQYYDKIVSHLKEKTVLQGLYHEWKDTLLYPWQYVVLHRVMEQNNRRVMWVYDAEGNQGKSVLASYLNIVHGFQLFDGTMSTKDLGLVLEDGAQGIAMDLARSSELQIDYAAIEGLKNGYIVTGKYFGRVRRFKPFRTVVFSNFYPDRSKLSADRWDILVMGQGLLTDTSKTAIIDSRHTVPCPPRAALPDLSGIVNLSRYLLQKGYLQQATVEETPNNETGQQEEGTAQGVQQQGSQSTSYLPVANANDFNLRIRPEPQGSSDEREEHVEDRPRQNIQRICPIHPDPGK